MLVSGLALSPKWKWASFFCSALANDVEHSPLLEILPRGRRFNQDFPRSCKPLRASC
jgi:hypothetical protein